MKSKIDKKTIVIIILAVALGLTLLFAVVIPMMQESCFKKATIAIVNNLINQLNTQGYVNLIAGNQNVVLVPYSD